MWIDLNWNSFLYDRLFYSLNSLSRCLLFLYLNCYRSHSRLNNFPQFEWRWRFQTLLTSNSKLNFKLFLFEFMFCDNSLLFDFSLSWAFNFTNNITRVKFSESSLSLFSRLSRFIIRIWSSFDWCKIVGFFLILFFSFPWLFNCTPVMNSVFKVVTF